MAREVTAQVEFGVSVNDKSVCVPMLVQPDSEQACLLGMSAIPLLGIMIAHDNGKPIYPPTVVMGSPDFPPSVRSEINLVGSVVVPSQKGRVWLKPLCPLLFRTKKSFY